MAVLNPTSKTLTEGSLPARLNSLRAGVLGANDGIVSTAGLVFGVAGATSNHAALVIAGLAGMVAGALSTPPPPPPPVSSQRDSELAALARQRREASADPAAVRVKLRDYYLNQGLSPDLADRVAGELSGHRMLDHHALTSLGIDAASPVSAWAAARASMLAFVAGALIPLLAIVFAPETLRLPITLAAVCLALLLTGWTSARLGNAAVLPAMARNLVVGSLTMALSYTVGALVGGQLS